MKTINVYNYGDDVIEGVTSNTTFTYEEFCKSIDFDEAYTFIKNLPHCVDAFGDPVDNYITDLLAFFAGRRSKEREIYIRHCNTYLTDYPSNNGYWRVQLHINIPAYPSIVRLYKKAKDRTDYQISFSGKDDVVLTFRLKCI